MKEFIEKLIGRLEEEQKKQQYLFNNVLNNEHQRMIHEYAEQCYLYMTDIVNELAEEYKTGLKDYHEGQEIEPYGRPRVYMSIEDSIELKAYRDLGTLHQIRVLIDRYHELNDSYHQLIKEEHNGKTIIDGQYCWQTCSALEHCKECNRLCNGSIDYYENYDVLAEEMGVAKNAITNADRIRSMNDMELAEWLTKITDDAQLDARTKCNYQWDDWLQSEADVPKKALGIIQQIKEMDA